MAERYVKISEYARAIINLKKLIKNAGSIGPVGIHNLLDGTVHPDTDNDTVAKGDIVRGSVGDKWERLARDRNGEILTLDNDLPEWKHKITISSDSPSGGEDGDIWFQTPIEEEDLFLMVSNGAYNDFAWRWHNLDTVAPEGYIMPGDFWYDVCWDAPIWFTGVCYHDGYIYAVRWSGSADWIDKIDAETGEIIAESPTFIPDPLHPEDPDPNNWWSLYVAMQICSDGTYVYIADWSSSRIVKYAMSDLSYVAQTLVWTPGEGIDWIHPHGICTDGTYLYVASNDNGTARRSLSKYLCSDLSLVSRVIGHGLGDNQFIWPADITTDNTYLYMLDGGYDTLGGQLKVHRCSDLSYVTRLNLGGAYEINALYGIVYYNGSLYFLIVHSADNAVTHVRKYNASTLVLESEYDADSAVEGEEYYYPNSYLLTTVAPKISWTTVPDEITVPAGVTELIVEAWGHGGKGGAGGSTYGGGGGGGGAFAQRTITVSPGDYYYSVLNEGSGEHTEVFKGDVSNQKIEDGGFENWTDEHTPTNWNLISYGEETINEESSIIHEGLRCIRVDLTEDSKTGAFSDESFNLTPNSLYRLSYWTRQKNSVNDWPIGVHLCDTSETVSVQWTEGDGIWSQGWTTDFYTIENGLPDEDVWVKTTILFYAHPDYTDYKIIFDMWHPQTIIGVVNLYIDDVRIEEIDPTLILSAAPGTDGSPSAAGVGGAAGSCVNADVAYSGGVGYYSGTGTAGGGGGTSAGKFMNGVHSYIDELTAPRYGFGPPYSGFGGDGRGTGNTGYDGYAPGGGGGGSGKNASGTSSGGFGFVQFRYKNPV